MVEAESLEIFEVEVDKYGRLKNGEVRRNGMEEESRPAWIRHACIILWQLFYRVLEFMEVHQCEP